MTVRRFTFDLHDGADGRTIDDVMTIKPNFLAAMGYQHFLSYGAPRARAFGAYGIETKIWFYQTS